MNFTPHSIIFKALKTPIIENSSVVLTVWITPCNWETCSQKTIVIQCLWCKGNNHSHTLNAICLPHKNATALIDNSTTPQSNTDREKRLSLNQKRELTERLGLGGWESCCFVWQETKTESHHRMTSDILTRTQPPIQCVRTSFLASSFASSAGKKNIEKCFAWLAKKRY